MGSFYIDQKHQPLSRCNEILYILHELIQFFFFPPHSVVSAFFYHYVYFSSSYVDKVNWSKEHKRGNHHSFPFFFCFFSVFPISSVISCLSALGNLMLPRVLNSGYLTSDSTVYEITKNKITIRMSLEPKSSISIRLFFIFRVCVDAKRDSVGHRFFTGNYEDALDHGACILKNFLLESVPCAEQSRYDLLRLCWISTNFVGLTMNERSPNERDDLKNFLVKPKWKYYFFSIFLLALSKWRKSFSSKRSRRLGMTNRCSKFPKILCVILERGTSSTENRVRFLVIVKWFSV